MSANQNDLLSKVSSLAKRRGYIYPSSEIYGGLANTYDFGPYGSALKRNVQELWWKKFIDSRGDIYGIDASTIINPEVWRSSGHTDSFADVMIEDTVNNKRYRADHIIEEYFAKKDEEIKVDGLEPEEMAKIIEENSIKSPDGNDFNEPRRFNQLFETEIGILEQGKNQAFLRGELAQGLFINYKNIVDSMHPKLPFGIGQVGKVFRNEITKGQFTFRTLEFDLMEFEYFFDPEAQDWNELFEYWKSEINDFALEIGLNPDKLRWRPHEEFELSHYSDRTEDLEYEFPWGYKEMFACAYRTDFDLRNHAEKSGKSMDYRRDDGTKFIPHVVEPTFGLSRVLTILLMDSYREEQIDGSTRTYLKLDPKVAPVKAMISALTKDEKLTTIAESIYESASAEFTTEMETTGSIGKKYRRHDEIGTPYSITVDFDTLEDKKVTVRDRDTLEQTRIDVDEVVEYIKGKIT